MEPLRQDPGGPHREPVRPGDWIRLALPFVVLAILVAVAWRRGWFDIDEPEEVAAAAARLDGRRWLAATLVAVYAGLAALALPVAPLGYGAGILFGFARGTFLVWIASMIGAAGGYVLARGAMRGPAKRILHRFAPVLESLPKRHGFLTILRLQLLPLIAFGPVNFAAGLAAVPFGAFMAGTAIGIIPGTLAIVYVGDRVAAGLRGEEGNPFLVAAAVGVALIAFSFVVPRVLRRLRR